MPTVTDPAVRTGLNAAQAARRLAEVGPNLLPEPARPGVWSLLARQLTHFFALLLWGAAILAAVAGMPPLGLAIAVVVVVNGVFAFVQEYRADRATERLRTLMPATASVRRDGHRISVPVAELAPDDIVLLEAGDRIGADLRLVSVHGVAVDESMLTGESVPRHPSDGDTVYAGTYVVEGAATALVTATGRRTRMAGIAALTGRAQPPPAPLAVRLDRVVKVIAGTALAVWALLIVLSVPWGAVLYLLLEHTRCGRRRCGRRLRAGAVRCRGNAGLPVAGPNRPQCRWPVPRRPSTGSARTPWPGTSPMMLCDVGSLQRPHGRQTRQAGEPQRRQHRRDAVSRCEGQLVGCLEPVRRQQVRRPSRPGRRRRPRSPAGLAVTDGGETQHQPQPSERPDPRSTSRTIRAVPVIPTLLQLRRPARRTRAGGHQ